MSDRNHRPQRGDKIYDGERKALGLQPNGYIKQVRWEDKEVTVQFLTDKTPWKKKLARLGYKFKAEKLKTFDFSELWGCYNARYRIYMLNMDAVEEEGEDGH